MIIRDYLYMVVRFLLIEITILISHVHSNRTNICDLDQNQNEHPSSDCPSHNILLRTKLNDFIDSLIETHFKQCYVIHVSKQDRFQLPTYKLEFGNVPTVEINLIDTADPIRLLNTHRQNTLIKFQIHCIVYHISLLGLSSTDELENVANLFAIPAVQIQSHRSYIVINEYDSPDKAKNFILSSQLANYKHRTWVTAVNPTMNKPSKKSSMNTDSVQYEFKHFCYYCDGGNPSIFSQGSLFSSSDDIAQFAQIFPDVLQNFHGHKLRVTAPTAPPLVHIIPSPTNPKEKTMEGMQAEILHGISRVLNFTYHVQPSIGGTGFKLPNGTWMGIMGDVMYDKVDIGISVAITYDRSKIVDFTVSVIYAFLILASTKPTPFFEWEAIFYPFTTSAWLAVSLSTIITVFVYRFFHNKSASLEVPTRKETNKKSKTDIKKAIEAEQISNFQAFYLTVGSLLEQGVPFSFDTIPSRMFATFWMFFAIIITCAYRSKLFAFLTFPSIEIPPNNFKELENSDYHWGMKSLGGVALLFVKQSPISYVRSLGERMEIYDDQFTCLDKTFQQSPRFTCMVYKGYLQFIIEIRYWKLRNKFHRSEIVSPPIGAAWSLKKNSPIIPKLNLRKTITFEMGLSDKYLEDYRDKMGKAIRMRSRKANYTGSFFALNTNYKHDDGDGTKPLEIVNLYGGFFILMFGCSIAGLVLLSEKVKYNKHNKISHFRQLAVFTNRVQRNVLLLRNRTRIRSSVAVGTNTWKLQKVVLDLNVSLPNE